MQPHPPKAGRPVKFVMDGSYQKDTGKTGLWIEVYDTIGEKMYYQNHFFNGKANYTAGKRYQHEVQWLMPQQIPAAEYSVKLWLKDWLSQEEYAAVQFDMHVDDIMA